MSVRAMIERLASIFFLLGLLACGASAAQTGAPACARPAFSPLAPCDKGGVVLCSAAYGLGGPDLARAPIPCLPVNQVIALMSPLVAQDGQWLHAREAFSDLYARGTDPRVQFWVVLINTAPTPVHLDLALLRGGFSAPPNYPLDWSQMRSQTPGAIVAACVGDVFTPGGRFISPTDSYEVEGVDLQPHEVRDLPVNYDPARDRSLNPATDHSGFYWLVLFKETAWTHYQADPRDALTAGDALLSLDPPAPPPPQRFPG